VVGRARRTLVPTPHSKRAGFTGERRGQHGVMTFVLWLIAVILVIAGIVSLLRGAVLAGLALIVVGLLVGPGGVSVFI
jgi:hypothetical protein